jgi:hypothetical protein
MDRCLRVTGTSFGQDNRPAGKPRGQGAHRVVSAAVGEGFGRSQRSTHGLTS